MQKEEKKSVSELGNERRRKMEGAEERNGELHQQTLKIQGAGNDGNGSSKKQEKWSLFLICADCDCLCVYVCVCVRERERESFKILKSIYSGRCPLSYLSYVYVTHPFKLLKSIYTGMLPLLVSYVVCKKLWGRPIDTSGVREEPIVTSWVKRRLLRSTVSLQCRCFPFFAIEHLEERKRWSSTEASFGIKNSKSNSSSLWCTSTTPTLWRTISLWKYVCVQHSKTYVSIGCMLSILHH